MSPPASLARRQLLRLGAGLPLLACRSRPEETGEVCPDVQPDEQWVELPLEQWPELAAVGIGVPVDIPEQFATLIVIQESEGCYVALWRICTHGACEVVFHEGQVICPCHGSRFSLEGEVLEGPATRALVAWEAGLQGASVWLRRPSA